MTTPHVERERALSIHDEEDIDHDKVDALDMVHMHEIPEDHHEDHQKFAYLQSIYNKAKERKLSLADEHEREGDPYVEQPNFQRINFTAGDDEHDPEAAEVCDGILKCLALRDKWIQSNAIVIPDEDSDNTMPLTPGRTKFRHRDDLPYDIFSTKVIMLHSNYLSNHGARRRAERITA
ncbi:hypothetical protein DYB31_008010 [Aphanomyces astaci]|uniref:Uncharacterized protein n=1 Tax=Aphanomyces astaci TaxID=112090 RepID=A0A397FA94_APHAT|nr:hypothetical protein DYB31_008010 [Aphanomyces astaci]